MATPGQTPDESLDKVSSYVDEKAEGTINDPSSVLSESHKSYLIERHGTLDLDPIPSMDQADPYNWPGWKVNRIL